MLPEFFSLNGFVSGKYFQNVNVFHYERKKLFPKDAKNTSRLCVCLFDHIFQEIFIVQRIDYTGESVNRRQFNQFIAYHIIPFI